MMKNYHNSSCRRVSLTLLLLIGIMGIWAMPAMAQSPDKDAGTGSTAQYCPPPEPDFDAEPTEACDSLLVYFTDRTTGVTEKYLWDFGDPASGSDNTSDLKNPTHMYRQAGVYTVTLTVWGPGTKVSVTKDHLVVIKAGPVADFVSVSAQGCEYTTIDFEDRSTDAETWHWDFGDGQTSDDRNPSHTYTQAGTYTVSLTVTNECGEDVEIKEEYIVVGEKPEADFEADKTEGCGETTVTFTDLSTNANTWHWDFGDGTTSNAQNPVHTYTAAGAYTVSLTVTSGCGDDTETKVEYITVLGLPYADFTADKTEVCVGEVVTFIKWSQNSLTWYWDFGDGTTSTDPRPTHAYSTPGVYTVTLTVTNDCGKHSKTRKEFITVRGVPTADFTSDKKESCEGAVVQFTDLSTDADTWYWEFGDGSYSSDRNPTHTYSHAGIYTVTLTVTNPCGDDSESKLEYITVHPGPIADFDSDTRETCKGGTISFYDRSQYADTWEWDFGDGSNGSTDPNPTHTYTAAGTYTVTLTVRNYCGTDREVRQYYITVIEPPIADFEVDRNEACEHTDLYFTDLSQYAASWHWDFGDGHTSTVQNPTHRYDAAGTYTVRLTVANPCGDDEETKVEYITIHPGPIADFRYEQSGECENGDVEFFDLSQYADTWDWDFGDGNTSTDRNPVHTYAQPGRYTVSLTVTNRCGDDTETKTDIVWIGQGPIADFETYNPEWCVGIPVDFMDRSTDARTWRWDFGDGGTSTAQNPSHTYSAPGLYTVTLTVSNACGDDTEEKVNYMLIHAFPTADFEADKTELCNESTVQFTDLSVNAERWEWDFGDGNTSSDRHPSHTYTQNGWYTVSLKVSNYCGDDTETRRQYIYIGVDPIADFDANTYETCVGIPVDFTDHSQYAETWSWSFGDGATSTQRHPSHAYSAPGLYTVTLYVTNPCGDDTEERVNYILVHAFPTADFDASVTRFCEETTVDFTDMSSNADRWRWDFGDGATSTEQNPSHTYTREGLYTVTLTVSNGCGDDTERKSQYIYFYRTPVADFTSDSYGICAPVTVNFEDQSQWATTWEWDFGDGNTSSDRNPSHNYAAGGNYSVTLTVTNHCGEDSETKTEFIRVMDPPTADFSANTTQLCVGGTVQFTNLSVGAYYSNWNFGDGNGSAQENPSHTYDTPGVYTVTLYVDNPCGDDDEVKTAFITVLDSPIADFTSTGQNTCTGAEISFIDQSQYATTWHWDFGDGNTSTQQNPSHTYTGAGTYYVTLTVTNPCGRDDMTAPEPVTVDPLPIAEFSADKRQICAGETVTFTDASTYAETWAWTFGDGGDSFDPNPTHTYTTPGEYTVTLRVTNACGPDDEVKELYIRVLGEPVADFYAEPTEICEGGSVAFTDLSQYATSWYWDFGDGTSSTSPNPSHVYASAGTFTVTLAVSNPCGDDTETKTDYITVTPGPTADFSGTPDSGYAPLEVIFTDLSTSDLGITAWFWEFGDGTTSTLQSPTHIYTAAGRYTVTLTVTDPCGKDSETKEEYVIVENTCTVDFFAEPYEGCAPLTVFFQGTTVGPCDISSWTWDFGDPASGNDNTATGQNAEHIYTTSGQYTVTLTAEDVTGTKVVTKTEYITVYGGPTADFTSSVSGGTAPLPVTFTDLSTSGTGIISWEWDFGDGTTSIEQNPSHTYTADGDYQVSLIVTDMCGPDTAYALITVSPTISIVKDVDKLNAAPFEELYYTVFVTNNGQEAINNLEILDKIPDSSVYVSGSISQSGNYDPAQDACIWTIPSIGAGERVEVNFRVMLDGPFTELETIVSNFALAAIYDQGNALSGPPQVFRSNTVETKVTTTVSNLAIAKSVSANLAAPGDLLTYTITVANSSSPAPAAGVKIFDAIPDSTEYVMGSISAGGTYDPITDSLYWDIGTLAGFGDTTVSFQVTIDTDCADGHVIPNTALFTTDNAGGDQSNQVLTAVSVTPLVITKKVDRPTGMIGDLLRYTITVENFSGAAFDAVLLRDTMPGGIYYVDGTSMANGAAIADPISDDPYRWDLGPLPANGTIKFQYTALIGASAHPGLNENVARARGTQGFVTVESNRAIAQVYILSETLTGSIRGIVIVDCDGDGVPDMEVGPTGMDIYLDDGSHSKVNEKGMFYFSTVRAGERVVALDERDMEGYFIPEDAQASVFAHVHETGESYIIFRVCPEYPQLDIKKKASIIPTVKVTKMAKLSPEQMADSMGVKIDYQIDIKSNGLADPTQVRVVDSFPTNTHLLLESSQELIPKTNDGEHLVYEITAAQERLQKSVFYSLRDITPGVRQFLNNKVHLEGDIVKTGGGSSPVVSPPAEVAAGPFLLVPPKDVQITLTPALFITSKADLQPPAFPQLQAVADSIARYADADIKVEGHTDYRRIHTEEFPSNWELGEARAKAVVDWLVDNREVERDRLVYESFAATRSICEGRTSEELQPNRRTEVIIKAGLDGFVDPSALASDNWVQSTSLALNPVKFDTLFEKAQTPVEIDIDDSWEVVLNVENTSAIAAENAELVDVLPDGVEYIPGSATFDGVGVSADASASTLTFKLAKIEPHQKLELRYRIRALEGSTPAGGGAASIEVKTSQDLPVVQTSNEVRFE